MEKPIVIIEEIKKEFQLERMILFSDALFGTRCDTRFILWCLIDSFAIYIHLKYYARLGCQLLE